MHLIRNLEILIKIKNQFANAAIGNFCLAFHHLVKTACAQSGRLLP